MLAAGARFGKYELVRRLAVGGMGEIFLARERGVAGFDRRVVIKRLLPQLAEKPGIVAMFVDEAKIVAHLVHPGIVQIYELGYEDGAPYLAMEYVPGVTLASLWERAAAEGVTIERAVAVEV